MSRHVSPRREFLGQAGSCGAYMMLMASLAPRATHLAFQDSANQSEVVATEPWGQIVKVDDGVWALVSTPFDSQDFTTVCNGGIVAGDRGVLAVEAFMKPEGARWLSEWAEKLTGRWPTDVFISHFHGDHASGHRGFSNEGKPPKIWTTVRTHQLYLAGQSEDSREPIANHQELDDREIKEIDLGNRQVVLTPRMGHTDSDLIVEVTDPHIVFTGDLVFNRMVPNYRDATPTMLNRAVEHLVDKGDATFVPGHGPIASNAELRTYLEFLQTMETSVRKCFEAGKSSDEAAKEFKLPKPFEDWIIFSPQVIPAAFAAWYRDFESARNSQKRE